MIELLVAVIIVATLVALLIFSYSSMIKKSEATTCLANRKTINRAFNIYRLGNTESSSLDLFLKNTNGMADIWLDNSIKCPTKGTYYASADVIICSIHNQLPLTPDRTDPVDPTDPPLKAGNIIPGTNEYGETGILANDKWVKDERYEGEGTSWSLNFKAGEKFYHNDKFYIATSDYNSTILLLEPNLEQGSKPWNGGLYGGIVETTGKVSDWEKTKNANTAARTFYRGDIVYENNNYYICRVPTVGGITIPNRFNPPSGNGTAWFKIE